LRIVCVFTDSDGAYLLAGAPRIKTVAESKESRCQGSVVVVDMLTSLSHLCFHLTTTTQVCLNPEPTTHKQLLTPKNYFNPKLKASSMKCTPRNKNCAKQTNLSSRKLHYCPTSATPAKSPPLTSLACCSLSST
jgi:hypothetical protein